MGGHVAGEDGKPVQGAKVTAVFDQPGGSTFETTTDKKGEWAFMGVGTGNWAVTAAAKGYLPVTVSPYVRQLEKNPKVTLKLEKQAVGLGVVQNEATFQTLEEGNVFFKDGKYDKALTMYEDFLSKNPGAYEVLLNIGDCCREKGKFDTAIQKYNQLIEQSASDAAMGKTMGAKGLAAIGLCFMKQGKLAEAQDYFKKSIEMAIQIKPDWPDPYYRVALTYLNKGDNAKAAGNLEKFIKLGPETKRTAQAKAILEATKK